MSAIDLINDVNKKWMNLVGTEVVAPLYPETDQFTPLIKVRINGLIVTLRVSNPLETPQIGIVRVANRETANFIRPADLSERYKYLNLFTRTQMILIDQVSDYVWLGIQANKSQKIEIKKLTPVGFIYEQVSRFDTVVTAFDGHQLIYINKAYDEFPAIPDYLRACLGRMVSASNLKINGLTSQQRLSYSILLETILEKEHAVRARELVRQTLTERDKLAKALGYSGAELVDYYSNDSAYIVTYQVDGRQFRSAINKDNLQVYSAGVCLAGTDHKYDLTTVVGVLRSGIDQGRIYITDQTEDGDDD